MDNLRDCGVLEALVKKHVADGRLYAAVCAAPAVVLGPWGLLNGLKVKLASDVYSRFTMHFLFFVFVLLVVVRVGVTLLLLGRQLVIRYLWKNWHLTPLLLRQGCSWMAKW